MKLGKQQFINVLRCVDTSEHRTANKDRTYVFARENGVRGHLDLYVNIRGISHANMHGEPIVIGFLAMFKRIPRSFVRPCEQLISIFVSRNNFLLYLFINLDMKYGVYVHMIILSH